jgi:hypothetical protein
MNPGRVNRAAMRSAASAYVTSRFSIPSRSGRAFASLDSARPKTGVSRGHVRPAGDAFFGGLP